MEHIYNRSESLQRRRRLRSNMTQPKIILWSRLRMRQLAGAKFRRQFGIGPYVVDFMCPELRLAVEVDGDSHYLEGAQERDRVRDDYIASLRISVLRFTNAEVCGNLDGVLETILAEVCSRQQKDNDPLQSPLSRGTGWKSPPF